MLGCLIEGDDKGPSFFHARALQGVQVSRPKHQHWVPQFYLRYFSTPGTRNSAQPKVWIFSKESADGDETLTNVRNVCGKRYLYSPVGDAGERLWHLDEMIGDLEATMGLVWPEAADGFIDLGNTSARRGLSLFVAVMYLRNPTTRNDIERVYRKIIEVFESVPVKADGSPDVDSIEIAGVRYPLDTSDWNKYRNFGKNDHDKFFCKFVRSEAVFIAEKLMQKRWSIVVAEQDSFITTDKPVFLEHQSRTIFGLNTPGVMVSFPLSPKRLLVMDDRHTEPANQYYPLLGSAVGAFNFGIWRNGSRFMITGRPIDQVLSEIVSWAEIYEKEFVKPVRKH